mgnify:FL=1|jgi:hypothetical protein
MKIGDLVRHKVHGEIGVVTVVNDGSVSREELEAKHNLTPWDVGDIGSARVTFLHSPSKRVRDDTHWYYVGDLEVINEQ